MSKVNLGPTVGATFGRDYEHDKVDAAGVHKEEKRLGSS